MRKSWLKCQHWTASGSSLIAIMQWSQWMWNKRCRQWRLFCADVIKKAVEKAATSRHTTVQLKFDNPLVSSTCLACGVYLTAMETLTQLRLNIVAGIIIAIIIVYHSSHNLIWLVQFQTEKIDHLWQIVCYFVFNHISDTFMRSSCFTQDTEIIIKIIKSEGIKTGIELQNPKNKITVTITKKWHYN